MTSHSERVDAARRLMDGFGAATGLTSSVSPRRYLWTDAFAVCNYLALERATDQEGYRELALKLVEQVHEVLGRHRPDDSREGWISGLPEVEGAQHPTAGGLRIGKPMPERPAEERPDPEAEWDRDGQYFHYITRWIHALDRVWRVTGEPTHHRWAAELAEAAHRGFLASDGRRKRLHWKMSIDLTRPQVPSAGHHDPLDGLLTILGLVESAPDVSAVQDGRLDGVLRDLREMCEGERWATDDPLGAGGLLVNALRCVRIREEGRFPGGSPGPVGRRGTGAGSAEGEELLDAAFQETVLVDAARSVEAVVSSEALGRPLRWRLGFREVGLAIGLRAAERLLAEEGSAVPEPVREQISNHASLADEIEAFWLDPEHRESPTWSEHRDISRVMLATTLLPDGYLG